MKKFTFNLFAIIALMIISSATMAQGGLFPLAGSTHNYTVVAEDDANNTLKWSVTSSETGFTINSDVATEQVSITWTTPGTYTLQFTETDATTLCATIKTKEVVVGNNSFDVSTVSPTAFCNSANGEINYSGSTTTTAISIPVSMVTGIEDFNPIWEITFTLTPNTGTTIESVTASAGILSGAGPYTVTALSSDSGAGTFNITMDVTGDIYSPRDVVLAITSARELTYNTPDVDTTDWLATQTINSIPNTSAITTD